MASFISNSAAETQAFAEDWGRRAQPGWVVGLVGELGAGKTQFVKGFARALGVKDLVLSPTFALLHQYTSGRLPLFHMDFYRLAGEPQIRAAGLDEYFSSDGVALIEWWDRWTGPAPAHLVQITFEALSETQRKITSDDPGP